MKTSLSKIISEVVREVVGGIKLRKIGVKLFSAGSSNYGDSHKDLGTVSITPLITSNNPKIEKLFSESEVDSFELWTSSETSAIICAEGILRYNYNDSSDHDGVSVSETLDIDIMKDEDWNLIKERIKPVLDQSDIDEAIREIGNLKKGIGQYKGDNKTLKQTMSDMGVVEYHYLSFAGGRGIFRVLLNGKYGVYNFNSKKMIIPALFDLIVDNDSKGREVQATRGEEVFLLTIDKGVVKIKGKHKLSNFFNYLMREFEADAKADYANGKSIEKIEWGLTRFFEGKHLKSYVGGEGGNILDLEYAKKHYKEAIKKIIESLKNQQLTN